MSEKVSTAGETGARRKISLSPPLAALLIALVLFLLSGFLPNGFKDLSGAINQGFNILRLSAILGFIAAGQTLVIISGGEGIDLSAGAVVTISALYTYRLVDGSDAMILPVLFLVLAIGAAFGLLNGLGISYLKVPPFVMTLGMAGVIQGILLVVTRGLYDGRVAPLLTRLVARNLIWGIPGILILWILFGILMTVLLERTRYGKELFAIGVNRTTARLSGVNVRKLVILTYTIAGALAAFSGFILVSWTQNAGLDLGSKFLFPSIAAVAVGGTLLSGGKGSYLGTMAGAIVIQLIQSLLTTMMLPESVQQIVFGSVLLVLVIIYGRQRGLRL